MGIITGHHAKHTQTYSQLKVIGRWEETADPGGNAHGHGKNMEKLRIRGNTKTHCLIGPLVHLEFLTYLVF